MGKRCFVYKCPTGRKSGRNDEFKFSLFKAPNDENLLNEWRRHVPLRERELNSSDRICAKHFEKRFIIPRFQQSKYGDFYEDNIRPKIAPYAVPTIFNDDEGNNKNCKLTGNLDTSTNVSMLLLPHVEVTEKDTVYICFNCLLGKCSIHKSEI